VASPSPISLVVHGHFYQPPRENPWTDEVPREPSAAPYHDWNARIHAECYRANAFARIHDPDGKIEAIVDNYDHLSFNFGPTLARWVWRHDAAVGERLRVADLAQLRRLGHGGAMAQAYAHPIVPLCDAADRRTQLAWGLADFRRRFGRAAEGLWLPETAVSPATLETLIELGVKYTVLAPEQIAAVRDPHGRREGRAAHDGEAPPSAGAGRDHEPDGWTRVDRDTLDTGRAYVWRHRDGSGRKIALAVFDGELSRAVAFGDAATRAENFLDGVRSSAARSEVDGQRLVLCASDGELWGHHKKFADLTLAFATHVEAARRGIEVTNLGAYLARHPPTWEARLAPGPDGEGTAWSCAHGLGRWQRDCGCHMGGGVGWNQSWRGPLRRALDIVRDAAAAFYEDAAGDLVWDPWGARDAYGDVVDEPVPVRERLLLDLGRPALAAGGEETRSRLLQLLELQRATLLMYASCGWFFDDIAGLEGSLVIRMGAHALDLLQEVGGTAPTQAVLDALAEGRSNRREAGTGADVFRRVARHRVTAAHAVGRAALESLVAPESPPSSRWEPSTGSQPFPRWTPLGEPSSVHATPGFDVEFVQKTAGQGTLAGRAVARRRRTGIAEELSFAAAVRPAGALEVAVDGRALTLADLGDEARGALIMADLPALLPQIHNPAVARLVVAAARELPPDGETSEGLARRAALMRVTLALLDGERGMPSADALRAAAEILDVMHLPAGAPDRRLLEERVWALGERGRPNAALKMLGEKLGFSPRDHAIETAAS
jgi:alpha-amylase/alpha-mannosidase (GH57 family)